MDTEAYTIRIAELSVDKSELSGRCHKGNQQKTKLHDWICSKVQLVRSSGAVKGRYRRAAVKDNQVENAEDINLAPRSTFLPPLRSLGPVSTVGTT